MIDPEKRSKADAIIDMLHSELCDPEKMYNCNRYNSPTENGCDSCAAHTHHRMTGPRGESGECTVILLWSIITHLKTHRVG